MSRPILFFGLLCLICALSACGATEKGPSPWTVTQGEDMVEQLYYEDKPAADILLRRVEFSGTEAAQKVNDQLDALWRQKLAEYAAQGRQSIADREFNGEAITDQPCYVQEENPTVFYNDGSLLSLVVDGYRYTQGAAHPFTYRYGCNFDAADGKPLSLRDIWGEDACEYAAGEIYKQLEEAGRVADFYPDLQENLLLNIHDYGWYMDAENVYIIYLPYDIGPYALGIVEFTLPK